MCCDLLKRTALVAVLSASSMVSGCAAAQAPVSASTKARPLGADVLLQDPRINQSSGLARSAYDDDRLWTHNDSLNRAQLFALSRRTGETLAVYGLRNTFNFDWEDMAAFSDDGVPSLLVADVGDNFTIRSSVSLYVVREPQQLREGGLLTPVRTLVLRYPDGPRDVEAVAVDEHARQVYLLSKRDAVPQLYRVALDPPIPLTMQIAEPLGPINIPRKLGDERQARRYNWVTAMDFDAAHRRAVVVTLRQAHLYDRRLDEPWEVTFQRAPTTLDLPRFRQIEAAALSADGRWLDLTSEQLPAPLARLPLPLPLAP